MSVSERDGVPAQLESVRRRFEDWRRARTTGTRIPERLWSAAVEVADRYGVHRTAKSLRVNYYGLKKKVEAASSNLGLRSGDGPTFVEIAGPLPSGGSECLLELEDDRGAKMRVHLKGAEMPDLVALSRSFWDESS